MSFFLCNFAPQLRACIIKKQKMINEYIGTAKDNMKSAIHNWYKFTAGFSYKFVDILIADADNAPQCIYEPFAGCGTTLVEAQKQGIRSVGNESQQLMCDITNAKLNWSISREMCNQYVAEIKAYLIDPNYKENLINDYHELLLSLYDSETLKNLYLIRNAIRTIESEEYRLFLNLALSQVLHKSALCPIAVPYIVRSKRLSNPGHAIERFEQIVETMLQDIESMPHHLRLAKVYKADSRKKNDSIPDNCCDLCITSPPYLNNLDYGEVSKVHSHFFELTKDWRDITEKVRHELVTGATTHYKDCDFDLEKFSMSEFAQKNESLLEILKEKYEVIKDNASRRNGKKSFHILMMHYFEDMYHVLVEMRRVLKPGSKAYLILGDSAPYGVHIPTTQYLGEIAQSAGFGDYKIFKIRNRGTKWNVKTRHNIELAENILELT